jgi:plastocyanin
VFIATAELTQDAQNPTLLGAWRSASKDGAGVRPHGEARARTTRRANILGIVALVPIALFFALPALGGGAPGGHVPGPPPGGHGPGQGSPAPGTGADTMGNTAPIDGAHELAISANNTAFTIGLGRERIDLAVGQPVNVALTSVDTLHDLTVDEIDFHIAANPGDTVVGGLVFDRPGTYVGYCSVPGHREAGMELEVVVR